MKNKSSKRVLFANIAIITLLALSSILYVTSRYKQEHFKDAQIDEIIFYITSGLTGGQSSSFIEIAKDNLLLISIVLFLLLLPVIDFYRNRIYINFDLAFLGRKRRISINPSRIPLRYKMAYAIAVLLLSVWLLMNSFGVTSYMRSLSETSQVYEQHYVDPSKTSIVFPENKRNLIYIYLESMENTVASVENGGQAEQSLIPELEAIAMDEGNVSFSNQETGLGGALPVHGTTWTVAAMTAQSGGVSLRPNIFGQDHNDFDSFDQFLPGAYMLGDVLRAQGYNQQFIMGSKASFGGRDKMLTQHGDYHMLDYTEAKKTGLVAKDYSVWWGYEDKKLFDFAKAEATRLSQLDSPFNLQLLTVDTHFTDGYLEPSCQTPHQSRYDNVHSCSSKQVGEFVEWIKQQPFAENTAIIISGDHLGMQTSYYDKMITSPDYTRTIYNAFINPAVTPIQRSGRLFSTLDMYPSTLAAIGAVIENDRLALGVNLFSDQPTLIEKFGGLDSVNAELSQRSLYYEQNIMTTALSRKKQ